MITARCQKSVHTAIPSQAEGNTLGPGLEEFLLSMSPLSLLIGVFYFSICNNGPILRSGMLSHFPLTSVGFVKVHLRTGVAAMNYTLDFEMSGNTASFMRFKYIS